MIFILLTTHVLYYGKKIHVSKLNKNSSKKVEVKCPKCGNTRITHYSSYLRSQTDMCQKCSVIESNRKYLNIGDKYGKLTILDHSSRAGYSIVECECGNIKECLNYQLTSGKTKSCGCLRKNNVPPNTKTGNEHWNWKGGISSDRDRFMLTKEYKNWREDVYKRDNYTCLKCGQVGYILNAHHIYAYSDFPEKRLDLDNGVTLCENCHKEFHYIYGHCGFTENDFYNYINFMKR